MFLRPLTTSFTRVACASVTSSVNRNFTAAAASSSAWSLGILNHVAIAVPDLDKASAFYRDVMKGDVSEKHALPEHGVWTVFVNLGNTKIELLHPYGEKSPIANFLAKNKDGGMHHICLEVDDIHKAMEDVVSKGIRSLDKQPKIGAHGKPVIFLHPKDCGGVLKGKRKHEMKQWCWYCDREFDDEKVLIDHQRAKHFKCKTCGKKLSTAGGLQVHCQQVHKENITKIDNAIEGRDSCEIEIFGMEGIPFEDLQAHIEEVEGRADANKRLHVAQLNPNNLREQLATFQAQKEALAAGNAASYAMPSVLPPGFPPGMPPGMPPMPGMPPGMPPMPGMPPVPALPPGFPPMPGMPGMPPVSGMPPGFPGMPPFPPGALPPGFPPFPGMPPPPQNMTPGFPGLPPNMPPPGMPGMPPGFPLPAPPQQPPAAAVESAPRPNAAATAAPSLQPPPALPSVPPQAPPPALPDAAPNATSIPSEEPTASNTNGDDLVILAPCGKMVGSSYLVYGDNEISVEEKRALVPKYRYVEV